jgi:tetratricopeptide (TPR) repeat protein
MSLGGLAELALARGDPAEALDLYRRSLSAFEAIGDRGEEARILSEMGWAYLANGDPSLARDTFFESVRAHTDVASVRGIGLSLIGLAATEAVEDRPETAVTIAAAAEVHAREEGIVVLYDEDAPGRDYLDRAEAALSADATARAREAGSRLSIKEALDLAGTARYLPTTPSRFSSS